MQEIWLPKEVFKIIKGYEYSLISYEETIKEKNRKEIIDNIKIHVFQPYYLRGTKYACLLTRQLFVDDEFWHLKQYQSLS